MGLVSIPATLYTAREVITYLGNMVERGLLAAETADRVYNQILRMGERGTHMTRQIRDHLNNILHGEAITQGAERGAPRARLENDQSITDTRTREIQSLNDRSTRDIANAGHSSQMEPARNLRRRNPATMDQETPGKSHFSIYYGTHK